ncbi:DNA polymerase I [Candidatus Erwinia haradaeae]|uniref:DNA polymerase I n=1 Tax=Candidatus Erwinia haradaeae TaxID=1922217 RepID=A0A803FSQ1_9GAMM|nr:DNA polymerase I [Candidatus Erwinia haradaeae]VFP87096.1 DNA polymerase I [Candidatus Erwinia haradaeae]
MIKIKKKLLILVDGSSYLYRAYYAFPSLTNSSGFPTGAMCGVLNMLRSLFLKYRPSHVALIFDAQGKTFRDGLFSEYKIRRSPMPKELKVQINPLYKILTLMGIPVCVIPGVEADDVIGTLALKAEKDGFNVLISTNDKDMAQLVTVDTKLINSTNHKIMGPEEILDKYGVPPKLIIDLLALMGDSSDSIPGVEGIGIKTAQFLLRELGGITEIYSDLEKVALLSFRGTKKIIEKLEKNKEMAFLSYKLATIKTNLSLEWTNHQLVKRTPSIEGLMKLFIDYDLRKWIVYLKEDEWWSARIQKEKIVINSSSIVSEETQLNESLHRVSLSNYESILDKKIFLCWLKKIKNKKIFAFSFHSDCLGELKTNIIGLSFSISSGHAAYLPISHSNLNTSIQLECSYVFECLKPLLEDKNIIKIGHNFQSIQRILKKFNITLKGILFDTMIASYVLNSRCHSDDVFVLARSWLNYQPITSNKISGTHSNKLNLYKIPLKIATYYAAEYTDVILKLYVKLWQELEQHSELKNIFETVEMALVPVISRLENNGVLIDRNILVMHSNELSERLTDLQKKAHRLVGRSFNLLSSKQIEAILPSLKNTISIKNKSDSLLSDHEKRLTDLTDKHLLLKIILEYRSLFKLKSTYTDKLPLMINPDSNRVHTSYYQATTVTGRLSSRCPNLQNIPVRNHDGRRIRQAFIAEKDYYILSADYSQIELRIIAHLSQDQDLLLALTKEQDIHCSIAAECFGVTMEAVSKKQRHTAKAINFGLMYGMSAFGLSRYLNISLKEAKIYIDRYFSRYPKVLKHIIHMRREVVQNGYVSTLNGRRLYFPDITSNNTIRRKAAERSAINASVQGTAADIIKKTMISLDAWFLKQDSFKVKMIMQIHDELVFEVWKGVVEETSFQIRQLMEGVIKLDVPLSVNIGIGSNWDQAH